MIKNNTIKQNIRLIFIFGITLELFRTFIMAIYSPYYIDKGLSLMEVSSIKNFQILAILLFEIPAGYLSDKFGRLKIFKISLIFFALGFYLLYLANDFKSFALAEFVYGIAFALNSGTLFGHLNHKIKNSSVKTGLIFSRYYFYQTSFTFFSGNIGVFLYKFLGSYIFIVSIFGFLSLLFISNLLCYKYKIIDSFSKTNKSSLKDIKEVFFNKTNWNYFTYSLLFTGTSQIIYQYWSLNFKYNLSFVFSCMMFSSILGTKISSYLYKKDYIHKKVQNISILTLTLPLLLFFFIKNSFFLIILFSISQAGRGMIFTDLAKVGNDTVENEELKSTIFSVSGTLTQISSVLFLTFNSYLLSFYSINKLWAIYSLIFLISRIKYKFRNKHKYLLQR